MPPLKPTNSTAWLSDCYLATFGVATPSINEKPLSSRTTAISRDAFSLGSTTPGSRVYGRLTRYFRPSVENPTAIFVGAAKIGPLFPLDGLLWPGGSRPKANGRRRCGLQ